MIFFRPDRRKFLKLGMETAGTCLVLAVNWGCSRTDDAGGETTAPTMFMPNAWLKINPENTVTVIVAESEMGQGPYT